jgi:hypothetical protein
VFLWSLLDLKRVRWEGPEALSPGKHTLEFDFKYDGLGIGTLAFNNISGLGRSGTGVLKVDGKEVARQTMEVPRRTFTLDFFPGSWASVSSTLTLIESRVIPLKILVFVPIS